jgi:hypothetical protein
MRRPEYSDSERKALIGLSKLSGMSDTQILRKIVTGVRGADNRKLLIIQWGKVMGLDASESLRIAQKSGLILTKRMPKFDCRSLPLDRTWETLFR